VAELSRSALHDLFASGQFATEDKFDQLASSFHNKVDDTHSTLQQPGRAEITNVQFNSGSDLVVASTAADYWQFFTSDRANRSKFYVWYAAGSSIDPLASGTGIQVGASTTSTSDFLASNTASAINAAVGSTFAVASHTSPSASITLTTLHTGSAANASAATASTTVAVIATTGGGDGGASAWNIDNSLTLVPNVNGSLEIGTSALAVRAIWLQGGSAIMINGTTSVNTRDGGDLNFNIADDIRINAGDQWAASVNTISFRASQNFVVDASIQIILETAGDFQIYTIAGASAADATNTHGVQIYTDGSSGTPGTAGWSMPASGHFIPITGSAQDIGSSARPIRSLYMSGSTLFMDNEAVLTKVGGVLNIGAGADLSLSATNTVSIFSGSVLTLFASDTGGSAIVIETAPSTGGVGTGDIWIRSGSTDGVAGDINIVGGTSDNIFGEGKGGDVNIDAGINAGTPGTTQGGIVRIRGGLQSGNANTGTLITLFATSAINMSALDVVDINATNNLILTAGSNVNVSATNNVILTGSVVDIAGGDLTLSGCGQILPIRGSAGGPSYSFAGDPDTGFLSFGADNIGAVIGGQLILNAGTGATLLYANGSNHIRLASGSSVTVLAPLRAAVGGFDIADGDLTLSGCGQIIATNGSVGAPSVTFTGDPTTGIYRPSADHIGMAVGGSQVLSVANGSAFAITTFTHVTPGTETAPGLAFIGDSTTGLFHSAFGIMGITAGGSALIHLDQGSAVAVLAPLVPGTDAGFSLGTPTNRWTNVRVASALLGSNLSILASDIIIKACGRNVQMGGSNITLSSVNVLSLGGSVVDIAAGDLTLSGSGQIILPDGSAVLPSLTWASISASAGFYLQSGRDGPSVAVGGGERVTFGELNAILTQDGSVGNVSYGFLADINTGMFRDVSGAVSLAGHGTVSLRAASNFVRVPDGSAGGPGLSFLNDVDTGLYNAGGDTLGFGVGGSTMMRMANGSAIVFLAPTKNIPADLHQFVSGTPASSAILAVWPAARQYTIPSQSGLNAYTTVTTASGTATFNVKHSAGVGSAFATGSLIGTISFGSSQTAGSVRFDSSVLIASGGVIFVEADTQPGSTIADFGFTILGRTGS
jgi:hypothetical protein